MRNTVTSSNKKTADADSGASDVLWGARAIGAFIDRSESQVYYLHSCGALAGATKKLSHKILVGSRSKLRELLTSETS